ncbi:MAG: hypothetical protein MK116_02650 [Phycisphaerales bacterium]|nr:hypothetical protein [Phycisphaerales bacterium]
MTGRRLMTMGAAATLLALSACQSTPGTTSSSPSEAKIQVAPLPAAEGQGWPTDALAGNWEGEAWRINSRGASRILDQIELQVDQHGLVTGTRTWTTLEGKGGHNGRTPVKSDVEELLGVFHPETGEFRLVEMNEPGHFEGRLVDRNTIEFFSTQPGRQPSTSMERLSRVVN